MDMKDRLNTLQSLGEEDQQKANRTCEIKGYKVNNQVKTRSTEWEIILSAYTLTQHIQNTQRTQTPKNNPIHKQTNKMFRQFSEDKIQMANDHIGKKVQYPQLSGKSILNYSKIVPHFNQNDNRYRQRYGEEWGTLVCCRRFDYIVNPEIALFTGGACLELRCGSALAHPFKLAAFCLNIVDRIK